MTAICDLHNHILPGMDDGCQTLEESLAVLAVAAEQGVFHLVCTPHYYGEEPVEAFLQRRDAAERLLREHLPQGMHICVGAEVAYYNGICRCEQLEKLCFGNSRFLLLELPFTSWNSDMFRELQNLNHIRGIIPIIAHLERYLPLQSKQAVKHLLENDVLVQMNAEGLLHLDSAFTARRLLKNGTAQLLGSDCHNLTTRPFNLGTALKKRGLSREFTRAAALSMEIFAAAEKM